jgi:hypothetical protein
LNNAGNHQNNIQTGTNECVACNAWKGKMDADHCRSCQSVPDHFLPVSLYDSTTAIRRYSAIDLEAPS